MVASSSGSIVTSGKRHVRGPACPPARRRRRSGRARRAAGEHLGAVLVGDHHGAEVGELGQMRRQAVEAGRVDEGHLGARVGQAVVELGARPPRVERDHDAAGRGRPPEGHGPLGQVAHGDGDPVAELDPEPVPQRPGDRGGDAEVLLVGGPLVLVDEVVAGRRGPATAPGSLGQVGGAVLPHPGGHAPDLDLLHLEHLTGSGEGARRLLDRHGGVLGHRCGSPSRRGRSARAPARVATGRRRRQASATCGGVHPASEGSMVVPGATMASIRSRTSSDERHVDGAERAGHLLHGAGADDGRGHRRVGEHEGQGQMGERHAGLACHVDEGLRRPRAWRPPRDATGENRSGTRLARPPSGMGASLRYRPVSHPPLSGLHTITPIP